MKNKLLLVFSCFSFLQLSAQFNSSFTRHLLNNNLKNELETYFAQEKSKENTADSLYYYEAKYFLRQRNTSLFYSDFLSAKSLILGDSMLTLNASCLFLKQADFIAQQWFLEHDFSFTNTKIVQQAYQIAVAPKKANPDFLPTSLQYTFRDYQKYNRRSPFLAGFYSALVPGLGKLYNGRKHTFWPSFFLNTIQAARAGESIYRYGWKNPYSIISVGIFSIFYFSNIYGSYSDLKQVKTEKRKNFLDEVADYYYISEL